VSGRPYWLLAAFVIVGAWFAVTWWRFEHANQEAGGPTRSARPKPQDYLIGFVTNFFDTLGIGSFAPTTAAYKAIRRMPDDRLPGTLNVGHALPTTIQAVIFVAVVQVDILTLVAMTIASMLGAWVGVGLVGRAPRRLIQIGVGAALLLACCLFTAANLKLMPSGGVARGLVGGALVLAILINFVLGALMMVGVGLYGPCLVAVSLLGMNPIVAFPIMMSSCAVLMPVGARGFIKRGRYTLPAALGLTLAGIPAVLVAAFIVRSLPLGWLRWLVVAVALVVGVQMLLSALRSSHRGAEALSERAIGPHG
jgi:uncharacterized membrane protein YfcA